MRFLDSAKIWVQSGHGGAGAASFRREKFIEFGGPNGGDGGRGGHVIAVADPALNTLIDFRYRQHFKAKSGQAGMKQERTGKGGEDIHLRLPVGTQIYAEDGETLLADLLTPGQEITICRGGDGGRGNVHFKTSTNRAPRRAEPGWPGEERWVWLELKLLADAGLVGLPNAGKSTFLAAVSRATPKIADYPFTTLEPMLGTILLGDDSFTIADIPGLIEGASEGKGLGDRFLGHIERCAALIHLVDATQEDVVGAWRTIRRELEELRPGPDRQARAALPLQDRRGGADRARAEEAQAQAGGQDRGPPDLRRRPPGPRPGPPRRRGAGPRPARSPPPRRRSPPSPDGPAGQGPLCPPAGGQGGLRAPGRARRPRARCLARRARPRRRPAAAARPAGRHRHLRCGRTGPQPAGPAAAPAAAGGEAGRRRLGPDPARPRLAGEPRPHRPRGRPDPDHARRHRGPPPLPQRPRHHRDPAAAGHRPGRQRERHGGDQRDPLRRQ